MLKRSECNCQCHSSIGSVSAVHIMPCCESDDSDILTKFISENDPETMRARASTTLNELRTNAALGTMKDDEV